MAHLAELRLVAEDGQGVQGIDQRQGVAGEKELPVIMCFIFKQSFVSYFFSNKQEKIYSQAS